MSIWCFGTVRFDLFWPSFHGKMSHESPWKPQLLGSCPHQLPKIYQILHTKTLAKPSLESEPCLDAPGRLFIVEAKAVSWSRFGMFRAWRTLDLGPVLWLQDAPGLWGWNLQQTESAVSKLVLHRSPLKGATLVSCAFKQQLVPQLNNMLSWNKTGSQCLAMLKRFQKWVLRAMRFDVRHGSKMVQI